MNDGYKNIVKIKTDEIRARACVENISGEKERRETGG